MKLTRIAFAVAALGATAAHASLPGLTGAGIPAANQIFISGASALTGSLTQVVTSMCDTAGGGVVTANSCAGAGAVVRCSKGKIDSGFSGAAFAVSKRDTDGSFAGVGPVIQGAPLTGWCDTTGVNTTAAIAPHAGLTDVETNAWIGMANTGALSQPVPAAVNVSLNGGFAGQGFGLMASEGLYRAMQVRQVNDGRLPASCSTVSPATLAGVAAADSGFTPGACQPGISKAEYAAVAVDGAFNYVTSLLSGAVNPLTGDTNPVNLCRRVETSGTQAASNIHFLNNSCGNAVPTKGAQAPKKVDFTSPTARTFTTGTHGVAGNYDDFGGVYGLFEGSGTGDARTCLSRRSAGTNPANVADTLGTYAIGVVSLENLPAAGRRYLKLDGVSPNAYRVPVGSAADTAGGGAADGWAQDATQRITTVRAEYDFAPEFEMLWPTGTAFGTALNRIRNAFADPAAVNLTGVFQANGVFTHAAHPTRVHKGTRRGNSCAPQILAE